MLLVDVSRDAVFDAFACLLRCCFAECRVARLRHAALLMPLMLRRCHRYYFD